MCGSILVKDQTESLHPMNHPLPLLPQLSFAQLCKIVAAKQLTGVDSILAAAAAQQLEERDDELRGGSFDETPALIQPLPPTTANVVVELTRLLTS